MSGVEAPKSYMRLHGRVGPTPTRPEVREFVLYATVLPAILGRAPTAGHHFLVDESDGTISREHAKVDWNSTRKAYEITCLSKNGAIVDKCKLNKDGTTLLRNNSAVRMGTAKFYISFPKHEAVESAAGGGGEAKAKASRKRKANDDGQGGAPAKLPKLPAGASTPYVVDGDAAAAPTYASAPEKEKSRGPNTPYQALIIEALSSGLVPEHVKGGHLQRDIVEYITRTHPELTIKPDTLKQGVYKALNKSFSRLDDGQPSSEGHRWEIPGPPSL